MCGGRVGCSAEGVITTHQSIHVENEKHGRHIIQRTHRKKNDDTKEKLIKQIDK